MKTELLAPAGSMEALKAAIANGCNAVYLGMQKFGARAYSSNFDIETLKEAIEYAHLRDVKVYVTMNTIVFENEISDMKEQLDILYNLNVDAIIVQDLAVFDEIISNYPDMEVHCSTQMGIDDVQSAVLMKKLGASRVVLAREVDIKKAKQIKEQAGIEVEAFVHGALCVSFSGNCLMSGLIGYRSGNRGRCVGSCRKEYEMINTKNNSSLGTGYILSMKDLNTIEYIEDLQEIDSLKIEGRMKEPAYVANVVSTYNKGLRGLLQDEDVYNLKKTFNRTFTKGYLFGEDKKDVTNIDKPNNYGYLTGNISKIVKDTYEITLTKTLNQNDIIRISSNNKDVNLTAVKLYDENGNLVNKADNRVYIKIKEKLSVGDEVFITKDYNFYKELDSKLAGEYKRFALDFDVIAYSNSPLIINATGLGNTHTYTSDMVLEKAKNQPSDLKQVKKQLDKLNDTIFYLNDLKFECDNVFIPSKILNQARREIVEELYKKKLDKKRMVFDKKEKTYDMPNLWDGKNILLTASVTTKEQYDICKKLGLDSIYFENIVPRNLNDYKKLHGEILIGGYGSIEEYSSTNPFVTDYSFNVVNSASTRILHSLGAKRVTVSYEINKNQLKEMIESYKENTNNLPALEMIVYGKAPLMVTNYCPLKKMGKCGDCKKNTYELRDDYGSFPLIFHDDCTVTILNGHTLNLLDEITDIKDVSAFRLNFTKESPEEVEEIINMAKAKLSGTMSRPIFDSSSQTRGHFNKEIL